VAVTTFAQADHPAVALGGVVSHHDAAAIWGIELVHPAEQAHVTVARRRSRAALPGVRVHRRDLAPEEVLERDGVLVTTPLQTLMDLSRCQPHPEAVAALDSALRADLVTETQLLDAAAGLPAGRGRPACRAAVVRVDPRSGSVLESLARLLFEDAGLRPFETQHLVRAGRSVVARVDFAWPEVRLIVEVDGFAFHADRVRYRSDRRRGNSLVLAGWQVLRFSWEDVTTRPAVVVGQVRRALAR